MGVTAGKSPRILGRIFEVTPLLSESRPKGTIDSRFEPGKAPRKEVKGFAGMERAFAFCSSYAASL